MRALPARATLAAALVRLRACCACVMMTRCALVSFDVNDVEAQLTLGARAVTCRCVVFVECVHSVLLIRGACSYLSTPGRDVTTPKQVHCVVCACLTHARAYTTDDGHCRRCCARHHTLVCLCAFVITINNTTCASTRAQFLRHAARVADAGVARHAQRVCWSTTRLVAIERERGVMRCDVYDVHCRTHSHHPQGSQGVAAAAARRSESKAQTTPVGSPLATVVVRRGSVRVCVCCRCDPRVCVHVQAEVPSPLPVLLSTTSPTTPDTMLLRSQSAVTSSSSSSSSAPTPSMPRVSSRTDLAGNVIAARNDTTESGNEV